MTPESIAAELYELEIRYQWAETRFDEAIGQAEAMKAFQKQITARIDYLEGLKCESK
jgi:hypothetical protein